VQWGQRLRTTQKECEVLKTLENGQPQLVRQSSLEHVIVVLHVTEGPHVNLYDFV